MERNSLTIIGSSITNITILPSLQTWQAPTLESSRSFKNSGGWKQKSMVPYRYSKRREEEPGVTIRCSSISEDRYGLQVYYLALERSFLDRTISTHQFLPRKRSDLKTIVFSAHTFSCDPSPFFRPLLEWPFFLPAVFPARQTWGHWSGHNRTCDRLSE